MSHRNVSRRKCCYHWNGCSACSLSSYHLRAILEPRYTSLYVDNLVYIEESNKVNNTNFTYMITSVLVFWKTKCLLFTHGKCHLASICVGVFFSDNNKRNRSCKCWRHYSFGRRSAIPSHSKKYQMAKIPKRKFC